MRKNSNNKVRKSNSKSKRPATTKYSYKVSPNILASDESKKLYQKLNAYPNYKFIRQLNTEKLTLFLNNYSQIDINVISKILPKYLYFQQMIIGAFEPRSAQPQNTPPVNFNNKSNINYQKKRSSKSLGKVYKNTKQKEIEKIQIKQKIFSSVQKHLSQTKNLLSLAIQSFKINKDISKYLSEGISENKSLQYISLNYCVMPVDLYEIILKGILTHEIIRCIDLSNNKLNDKYSLMISRIIQRQAQRRDQIIWSYQLRNELPNDNNYKIGLISINLHGNQLGKKSAEFITDALNNDQYIRYIDLSKNYFDNSACKLFVHMMRKNNTLLTVDLRENTGYDEFINPRLVMKMSKNIKFLYSQYQNGKYTEEEFEYLKGFIDISFFDVDIPQEIVEYYNTNVQQTTDVNAPNGINKNNNINTNQNINNENINNINEKNINNYINNNNNNNIQEENEEEQAIIKNSEQNSNNNNNNKNNINANKPKNVKNMNGNKENIVFKENQKLIQENLQLKQEILELKAKNLQKMLKDGLVPQDEDNDLENYYSRANEIIDTLNEVMAKLQKHKSGNNNNNNQNNINNININEIRQKANNIINNQNENINDINENKNNNNILKNNINQNNNNNNQKNKDINNLKNNDININNKANNNKTNNTNNIKDNIKDNINSNVNNTNQSNNKIINEDKNIKDIDNNKINDKNKVKEEKDLKEKKPKSNEEIKEKEKKDEIIKEKEIIQNNKNDKKIIDNMIHEDNKFIDNDNENNNINISDEDENDFNLDDLPEEEKIALIQQRQILMKLQEEAEARGEHFDIQEYLAQLEAQGDDDEDEEFEQQRHNDNKLNKSF